MLILSYLKANCWFLYLLLHINCCTCKLRLWYWLCWEFVLKLQLLHWFKLNCLILCVCTLYIIIKLIISNIFYFSLLKLVCRLISCCKFKFLFHRLSCILYIWNRLYSILLLWFLKWIVDIIILICLYCGSLYLIIHKRCILLFKWIVCI